MQLSCVLINTESTHFYTSSRSDPTVCTEEPLDSQRSEAPVCFMQIMGSAHNMFGSVNVLTVRSSRCSEESPAGEPQLPIQPRIFLCTFCQPARLTIA